MFPTSIYTFIKKHRIFFLAMGIAVLRFVLWDAQLLTDGFLPRHDGAHGFTAFATSMHSIRTEGDIAWWNPLDLEGYAQYYNAFLGPLSPNFGNILFILCAGLVRFLSFFSIIIPEYLLYVLLNSLLAPFLTVYFLLKFSSLFFSHTAVLSLIGIGYTFSGIGLWNDAWFYWHSPMFLFLLLYVLFAYLQDMSQRRYFLLWLGVILFAAGADFWAVHNLLFLVLAFVAFFIFHPKGTFTTACKTTWTHIKTHKLPTLLCFGFLCIIIVQLFLVFTEQSSRYYRLGSGEDFSAWEAFLSGTRYDQYLRFVTVELFRPSVDTAFVNDHLYTIFMHGARYIGAGLLPLLGIAVLQKNKTCRMFLFLSISMLILCLIPGFMMPVWEMFFSSDRAFFFYYVHFLQVSLLFLAASGLAVFLQRDYQFKKPIFWIFCGGMLFCIAVFAGMAALGWLSKSVLLLVLLVLISTGLLLLIQRRENMVWLVLFLVLFGADLTRYYYECAHADNEFSGEWYATSSFVGDTRLFQPLSSENNQTFGQNITQLSAPVQSSLWPKNKYLITRYHAQLVDMQTSDPAFYEEIFGPTGSETMPAPATFYSTKDAIPDKAQSLYSADIFLSPKDALSGSYTFLESGYNSFVLEYTLPSSQDDPTAYILLQQLYDPAWKLTLDAGTSEEQSLSAVRANVTTIAAEVPAGTHTITMEYMPFSRQWYPLFCIALVLCIPILLLLAFGKVPFIKKKPV